MSFVQRALHSLILALLLASAWHAAESRELPGDSIYRLGLPLVDQDSHAFHLSDRRGRPQLISMFYTSCQYVCPLIIDTLRKTQQALELSDRKRVGVLLVSFDPQRDTPQRLKEVYGERKLDSASWTLARTGPSDVRKLAAVLDIQYRALANREINHSSSLTLLDADGRIVARTDKIGAVDPEFVAAIHKALKD